MKNFKEVIELLQAQHICRNVAVVCPRDEATQLAVKHAEAEGLIHPIIINEPDLQASAEHAIDLVQKGEADMIMKGLINTAVLLRAILHYNGGILPEGKLLTQLAVAEMSSYHKLLSYTDAAVLPFPTHEQRVQQVQYIVELCQTMKIETPKVSLIHCSEEVDARHFPYTEGYREIVGMAERGEFGSCIVDGPLDLKTSCDPASMAVKGIRSKIAGDADALVFPDIESSNVFHKAITLWCGARMASLLQGASVPVVLTSRADSEESKFYSIVMAALIGRLEA